MINILVSIINVLSGLLILLLFVHVILSYILDPYHPIRRTVDRIVEPILAPIRRVIPPIGGLDFSPVIMFFLIQILSNFIIRLLLALR